MKSILYFNCDFKSLQALPGISLTVHSTSRGQWLCLLVSYNSLKWRKTAYSLTSQPNWIHQYSRAIWAWSRQFLPLFDLVLNKRNMSKPVDSTTFIAAQAVLCGLGGGAISYFLLKRTDSVRLFGMEISEVLAKSSLWLNSQGVGDGLLLVVESLTGDLVGAKFMPWMLQTTMGQNEYIQKAVIFGLPPVIAAAAHLTVKKFASDSDAPIGQECLLAAGTKLLTDGVSRYWLQWGPKILFGHIKRLVYISFLCMSPVETVAIILIALFFIRVFYEAIKIALKKLQTSELI